MNIEKVIQEDRQAKLTVEYTLEEFEGFKRRAAKQIAKNAKIPGFRPGKAPYNVIVNHYGEGAILQEAIDILLENDYGKIIDDAEIEPSGAGSLDTIESYDPPKFVFMVPLEPEVTLPDYRAIRKPYELEEFDQSEVDKYITDLQRNAATIVPADHAANPGDLVYFNLSGEFLNPEDEEDATITDKTPQQVLIPAEDADSKGGEWPFAGFAKELTGVQAGEIREIQHTYPEDYYEAEYQGKTAVFTVEVQSVKELELPELDEDFIQTLGDFESLEELRESVEKRLRAERQRAYDVDYFNELYDEITENTKMTYPPQMLAHEEEHVLEDMKSRLEQQNLDLETFLKFRGKDEETFLREEINPVAKQRLERSLVVDALVDAEGIKLDQEMLKEQINEVMTEIFYSGNAEDIQNELGKEEFSRSISMEGVTRTMNTQIHNRMKLIATGQPIPEPDDEKNAEAETDAEGDLALTEAEPDHELETEPAAEGETEEHSEDVVADLEDVTPVASDDEDPERSDVVEKEESKTEE